LVTAVSINEQTAWQRALKDAGHPVYQTWDYCNAMSLSSGISPELAVFSNTSGSLAITFCRRSKREGMWDIYSPYGFGGISFSGEGCALVSEMEDWFRSQGIVTAFLMGHPEFNGSGCGVLKEHRTTFVLDLAVPTETLWKQMASGHKYEIKKSEKEGVEVISDPDRIFSVFPSLYSATIERVHASAVYDFSVSTLKSLIYSPSCIALGAFSGERMLAAVLVAYVDTCAEYLINAALPEGRGHTRLLLWQAIQKLKSANVGKFHLGGGAAEGDSLEQFKRRIGGKQTAVPVYRAVLDQDKYESLVREFGGPDSGSAYFPPYWAKKN
jgi:hypothetical protein